jgi:IS30 family transposase
MSQNCPKITKKQRRRKLIEFRAQGLTLQEIADKFGVNEKTIDRDLQSVDIKAFDAELIRRQLNELEGAEKVETRLHFRDRLLDKLLPKKVEQKVSGELSQKVEVEKPVITLEDLMGEYGDVIFDEVMRRRLQSDRGTDGSESNKSVDTPPSN